MSDWEERHYEEKTDEWGSPPSLWRPISQALDGFDLDPCSGAESSPIADEQYTAEDDGLHRSWFGTVWVNPPYSDMGPWMKKGFSEVVNGNVETAVYLIPVRSSTEWWHRYVSEAAALCMIEGRISYVGGQVNEDKGGGHNAPFASALAVYGDYPDELLSVLDRKGVVYEQDQRRQRTEQARITEV